MGNINFNKFYNLEEYMEVLPKTQKDDSLELANLENLFSEDIDKNIWENMSKTRQREEIVRYQQIVKAIKKKFNCKCQICGQTFLMDNGKYYCEAHHIVPLSENGSQKQENVILLCANHHRMFHYAKNRIRIGELIDNKRIIYMNDVRYDVEF